MQPVVTIEPGGIFLRAGYNERDRSKSIPAGRWLKAQQRWRFPATPAVAASILETYFHDDPLHRPLALLEMARPILQSERDHVEAAAHAVGVPTDVPHGAAPLWPERFSSMWEHQRAAYFFALRRNEALLAAAPGAGKTRTSIEIANDDAAVESVLVVSPLSVVPHWMAQLRRYSMREPMIVDLTQRSVRQASIAAAEAMKKVAGSTRQLWLLANRERFWRPPLGDLFLELPPDMTVLDEIHMLKSPSGRASTYAAQLGRVVPRKLGLSGTPLAHSPLDGYGLFRCLDPGVFGTNFVSFRNRFAIMGGYEGKQVLGYTNLAEYRRRYYWLTFEVNADVLDLPASHHVEHEIRLPARAREVYRSLRDEFVAELDGGILTAKNALAKLVRLQQITSGYAPHDDDDKVSELHQEKRRAVKELIEELPEDERLVVFCRFIHDLDAVHLAAKEAGASSCELSGRRKELDQWELNRGGEQCGPRVIAVQIRAGGLGVDSLKLARHCVFFSLSFSLAEYDQALARVLRPGQTRTVIYHHLVATGTIDRHIYRALRERRDVIEEILHGGAALAKPLLDESVA